MLEKSRREVAFGREQDSQPGSQNLDWRAMGPEVVRRALGFRIGEATVDPFDPVVDPPWLAAAVATGPP